MSSYRQILYHIVFCTKDRKQVLSENIRENLFRYIWGIVKSKGCVLYRINGMEDHIHLLSDLNPTLALSDYIRDIKRASSSWMKEQDVYCGFDGWADGYGAFTYAYRDKEMIMNYIRNQQIHHKKYSFIEEYKALLEEHHVVIDERYFP